MGWIGRVDGVIFEAEWPVRTGGTGGNLFRVAVMNEPEVHGSANLRIGVREDVRLGANTEIGAPGVGGPGRAGPVWHREYWDRYIRDEGHLEQVVAYVHLNPVKAGLVVAAEDWRWSSAYVRGNANTEIGRP